MTDKKLNKALEKMDKWAEKRLEVIDKELEFEKSLAYKTRGV